MRLKDFIETLSQYDPDTELVIDLDGKFVTPSISREVVHYKHDYSGASYKDTAVVLSK